MRGRSFAELIPYPPDDPLSLGEHRTAEEHEQRQHGQDHAAAHGPGAHDEAVQKKGGIDKGAELVEQINELYKLLYAYRNGFIKEKIK